MLVVADKLGTVIGIECTQCSKVALFENGLAIQTREQECPGHAVDFGEAAGRIVRKTTDRD